MRGEVDAAEAFDVTADSAARLFFSVQSDRCGPADRDEETSTLTHDQVRPARLHWQSTYPSMKTRRLVG